MKPVALLLILAAFFVGGCSPALPVIDDPGQLVKECRALAAAPDGSLDPAQWPPSVKRLHPMSVRETGGCTIITTFMQTGAGARGYMVTEKALPTMDHYQISPTTFAGIYRYEFQP